jgi:hypothetical protein
MKRAITSVRHLLGVLAYDTVPYLLAIAASDDRYLALCNRNEYLLPAPDGSGFACDWQWTSELHAPKSLPALGHGLMRKALARHAIERSGQRQVESSPVLTFVIGHRGPSRTPHLLATLESIAAQRGPPIECIVVEQDTTSRLAGHLPEWVRVIHTPPPWSEMPYCRSWAFNVGCKQARGEILVLHDNDILIPVDYAAQIVERMAKGWDVVNLKRFIFYLSQGHTEDFFAGRATLEERAPASIMQNAEGGGSIAITRDGFERIGGLDESFVGWGGEDNEFWERAQSLRCWRWASLPVVHLCHAAQPGKRNGTNPTEQLQRQLSLISVATRIETLRQTRQGERSGPATPRHSYLPTADIGPRP